jgi:hypothetical protein
MTLSRSGVLTLFLLALARPAHAGEARPPAVALPWPLELPCKQFHDAVADGRFPARWEFAGNAPPLEVPASQEFKFHKVAEGKALRTRWTRMRGAPPSPEDDKSQNAELRLRCQDGEGPYLGLECTRQECSLRALYPGPAPEASKATEALNAVRATTDEARRRPLSRTLFIEMLGEVVRTLDVGCPGQRCSEAVKRLRSESVALSKRLGEPLSQVDHGDARALQAHFDDADEQKSRVSLSCGVWLSKERGPYDFCKIVYPCGSGYSANVTLSWMRSVANPERSVRFALKGRESSEVEWTPAGIMLLNDALRLR